MKKALLFAMIVLAAFYCTPNVLAESSEGNKTPGVGQVLLRGVSNVGLGIIAVPKNIVYENAEIPVLGILTGFIGGTLVFVWREFAGAVDILSFGFSGYGLYFGGMSEYPWGGHWLPPEYQ